MPGLINLASGLSSAGSSIAESAGQAGLLAQKAAMERQTLLLQDQLAGGKYERQAKALALVPQRLSIDTYLKATGHPGGLADFGMGDGGDSGTPTAQGAQPAQDTQTADSAPPQGSLINSAPADGGGDNFARNTPYIKAGVTNFQTQLSPAEEAKFRQWVAQKNVPFAPDQKDGQDYDMRGFWKALQSGDTKATTAVDPNDGKLHFPDYWKTPYHQTFSNESQWATQDAPHWSGDKLVDNNGRTVFDDQNPGAAPTGMPSTGKTAFPNGAPVVTPIGTKGKIMGVPLPPGWTAQQAAIAGPEALQKAWSEWSKPQNMRANSTLQYFDFKSGQMKTLTRNPEMPIGSYYDADTNSAVQINNAGPAIAASAKAKAYGESQGSLPADLRKIGAQGSQARETAGFQKGLDVATDLVPSYDPVTQSTTMVTKYDALKAARGGAGVKAPPALGGDTVIKTPDKAGVQNDGSYKTPSGTIIPPAPKIPGPDGGLQAAPSAADKATQETYAPIIKGWQDSVTPSIMAEQRFQAIAQAMKATETGAWASTKQDIAHSLMAHGIISADTAKSLLGADVGEAQIILKNNFGTALNTLSAARLGRITQNEIFAMQKNLPAIGNQPEANMAMIAQGIGTSRFQQALANDWNIARQRGYADPLTYEAEWTKANPLQGFIDQAKTEVGSLKGMPNAYPAPPPDAVRQLKMMGKSGAGQFDQIFGPGAADRVLGSK